MTKQATANRLYQSQVVHKSLCHCDIPLLVEIPEMGAKPIGAAGLVDSPTRYHVLEGGIPLMLHERYLDSSAPGYLSLEIRLALIF